MTLQLKAKLIAAIKQLHPATHLKVDLAILKDKTLIKLWQEAVIYEQLVNY